MPGNKQHPDDGGGSIRAIREDDFAAMARLHAAAFVKHWSADAIGSLAESPGVFGLVALHRSGSIAGFVLARIAAREGEILTIVVASDSRQQGIATDLLERAIEIFSRYATEAVFLEVAEVNEAAIKLYKRQGFVEIGKRPNYTYMAPGTLGDALVMRRVIA
ncbi:MAG: GNAT family N-acetyltransferase [Fimbriimonadaceae bacterium]|nr:GNAT family N-acetyltransferase [Alphaproteobacteria bacterium]